MKLDEKNTNKIINILDNLLYWETCPEEYKEEIPKLMKALNMHIVSISNVEKYAEFCVMCDRDNIPLLKYEDFLARY